MTQRFTTQGAVKGFVRIPGGTVMVEAAEAGTASAEVLPLDPDHEPSVRLAEQCEVRFDRDRLVVFAPQQGRRLRHGELAVHLALPASSTLSVKGGDVDITVEGGLAALDARIGSGFVRGDAIDAVSVRAGRVDVQLDAADVVRVATGDGSLTAQHVRDAAFTSGSGQVHLGRTEGRVVVKGGSVDLTVGAAAAGDIALTTGAGGARVSVVAGTTVQVDLISGSGAVSCEMPMQRKGPEGGADLRLRLKTGSGDVHVAPVHAA
jgi:hypothetical protein